MSLGVGLARVQGKVFRIGHLGNMDEIMLCSAICGAELSLVKSGVPIELGSGIAAALKHLDATSKVIPGREALLP